MALLKYFKIEKHGPPLPNPFGPLNQQLSGTAAIEEAKKEVTAALYNSTQTSCSPITILGTHDNHGQNCQFLCSLVSSAIGTCKM